MKSGGKIVKAIASSKNTGDNPGTGETTMIFPKRNVDFTTERFKEIGVRSNQISATKRTDCLEERYLLESMSSGQSFDTIVYKLTNYLRDNSPCLGVPVGNSMGCETCGDTDDSGTAPNVSDIVNMVSCILGDCSTTNLKCSDINNDGIVDILDVVELVTAIMGGSSLEYLSSGCG